ncbi:DmsC/YnfH family molybdoenzyme membrane anchor subunit [Desulfosporosinus sp. BICA1-9]|uniref:dimethyl sulfoxide reductase anchor subunit family protein n=1 Tax=Desulfosporosinus sp. BICA1-9 TaxID=1531958 RepID=UPI00054C6016|nr:DmsC/YnfH family molybdoenzyme membrane anchor subunit [Desulfosporosinus sp. BICA1-9]KJS47540.1 MAG: DMSO reductase [Peptococcaceae bacterium BRH_c23]KJS89223.1 MAG: DMSO reductase [Desulfosporosinus sp. BICA1-9]HBW35425.1 DMSO reductase [Desulfosporosinus sp.]
MGDWEWPLILFTVLGQIAIGIILMLWWLDRGRDHLDTQLFKQSVLISGGLLILALLASLFHLGHPEAAYRALAHLGSSWLSREILLFLLTFLAWIYLFWQSKQQTGSRTLGLGITSVLGLLGVVSSAMIYVLLRVPAWNNAGPVLCFLLTTGLLGALCTLVLGRKLLQTTQKKLLLQFSLGCTIASLLLYIIYSSMLSASTEGAATLNFLLNSPLFWSRALLGWFAPLLLLISILKNPQVDKTNLILTVTLLAGLGEILGRALFYLSATGIQITALF